MEDTREEIAMARDICAHYISWSSTYWQLAIEEGCDYVHLGQEDLDDADVPTIREAGLKLGISTHDELNSTELVLNPDYVALGPVYPTILKKMRWSEQGLGRVSDWKQRIGSIPLVAIGGMTVDGQTERSLQMPISFRQSRISR